MLVAPGPPGQGVEDDGVLVAAVVEAGVEVQGQVVGVVADVDGEAGREAEVRGQRRVCSDPSGIWPGIHGRVCRTHQGQPSLGFTFTFISVPSLNDKPVIFCGDQRSNSCGHE